MKNMTMTVTLSALLFLPVKTGADEPVEAVDLNHLERVSETGLDELFVRSGVSLEQFRAVSITQPVVSFRENWLRDQNRQRDGEKIKAQDMDRIGARVSEQLVSILETEFVERGHEVVSPPAQGVLIVAVQITDLDVVGPDTFPTTQVEAFSEYSSSMTLEVQLRDGASNEVLVWSRDRQHDIRRGYLQSRTRATNNRDSRQMIGNWAKDLFDTLDRA